MYYFANIELMQNDTPTSIFLPNTPAEDFTALLLHHHVSPDYVLCHSKERHPNAVRRGIVLNLHAKGHAPHTIARLMLRTKQQILEYLKQTK